MRGDYSGGMSEAEVGVAGEVVITTRFVNGQVGIKSFDKPQRK
jgi:hypothetical protein